MPADSEPGSGADRVTAPSLPHTWRPLGVRVAVWLLGGLLLVLVVAVWIGIGAELRSQFTPFQRGTLVLIALLLSACYHALVRSRVTAATAGLTVVNGYRTRSYEWSQGIDVSLRR